MTENISPNPEELKQASQIINQIMASTDQVIIGQRKLRLRLITGLLTDGHILLEGVPGLAKTLTIKTLAGSLHGSFKRIQFTPDLLPADLIGTEVYRVQDGSFEVRKGPVFANFVLADEINRAPAKVQSALLEIMQERQVTIGNQTFEVPRPFLVLATQNPIEQEGTYPLPEAQIDRFLMKVKVDYPAPAEEKKMLDHTTKSFEENPTVTPVASFADLETLRKVSEKIYVDDRIKQYIIDIVWASRRPQQYKLKLESLIELGASPRASIALLLSARAEALINGQTFVVPQHVKDVAHDVLRHRIMPTYEAEAQAMTSDDIITSILNGVQVP